MSDVQIREMTPGEFDAYRHELVRQCAREHVRAGNWDPARAEGLAAKQTDRLLPDGAQTPRMVPLVGEVAGQRVGALWVGLTPPPEIGSWLFDIQVVPEQRGRGYGRLLIEAAERELRSRGGDSLGLNLFGGNAVARRLCKAAGYQVTAVRMRQRLGPTA